MDEKKGYRAKAKYLLMAPRKVRPVADLVRRMPCSKAMATLQNMPNKGAKLIRRVLQSAMANALFTNKKLDEDMLFISELMIDDGPRMKRMWPRSHGRADRLLKRLCHITIVVDEIGKKGE